MGNRTSSAQNKSNETVYDILEISESATKEEIKKQYHKMLLRNHPDLNKDGSNEKIIKIREAYNKLKDRDFKVVIEKEKKVTIIDFSRYNRKFWINLNEDEFFNEANSIIDAIIDNERLYVEKIHMPQFGNKDRKNVKNFYAYYEFFKTNIVFISHYTYERQKDKKYFEKIYDKGERKKYNDDVRKLIRILQSLDPRLKIKNIYEPTVNNVNYKKEEKIKKKRVKKNVEKYLFYCDACLKGYMSLNTMQNHLKTLKHKEKLKEKGMEDIDINEIILNMEDKCEKEIIIEENTFLSCESENDSNSLEKDLENLNLDVPKNEFVKNKKNVKNKSKKPRRAVKKKILTPGKEHGSEQILKCSICHEFFDSRNKLFEHIRNVH